MNTDKLEALRRLENILRDPLSGLIWDNRIDAANAIAELIRLRGEVERMQWQGISTAPKDVAALVTELESTMSRYDENTPPDDENGMASPIMLGPEYFRKIIEALRNHQYKIKTLVWEGFGLERWADSVIGRYYISGHGGKWSWTFDDDDPYHHGEIVASEDAAISACQGHLQSTVMSAFRAPTTGGSDA